VNNKWIPWVIGLLVVIAISVSAYGIGRIDMVNKDLQSYKLDAAKDALSIAKEQVNISKEFVLKEDFKCTISDLKKQIEKIDTKTDTILKELRK